MILVKFYSEIKGTSRLKAIGNGSCLTLIRSIQLGIFRGVALSADFSLGIFRKFLLRSLRIRVRRNFSFSR